MSTIVREEGRRRPMVAARGLLRRALEIPTRGLQKFSGAARAGLSVQYRARRKARQLLGLGAGHPFAENFMLDPLQAPSIAAQGTGRLWDIFFSTRGKVVHKWLHYLPLYERYFAPYVGKPLRFLEIGVCKGGSLNMWRRYFGPEATIYGVDINPECAALAEAPNQIRIGSQDDSEFLNNVVREMGALDIVLDDGSHIGRHQIASFEILFPHLKEGGLYIVEDLHTAYWTDHEGGYRHAGTFVEYAKQMTDDMHAWYHGREPRTCAKQDVGGVFIHDSIVVIEKRRRHRPANIKIGL